MIDIKGLVESRLRIYDPLIDLAENGFAQELVVKPIVKAFGSDPMSTDIRTFLISKFNELYPSSPISNGDAVTDILINVGQLYFEAYRQELQSIKRSLSIDNLNVMSDADADALASNWLVSRKIGTKATGTVRITVNRLASLTIDTTNIIKSQDNVMFFPTNFEQIDTSVLLANRLPNANYYFDLNVTAALPGSSGNVSQGSIVSIQNISGLVSITNLTAFSGGSDTEDNSALLRDRLPRSATERSLVTKKGISARLENYSGSIRSVEVVGFGDIEMVRDKVNFDGKGAFKTFGVGYGIGNLLFVTFEDVSTSLHVGNIIRSTDNIKLRVVTILSSQNEPILMDVGKSYIVYTDIDLGVGGKALLLNLEDTPSAIVNGEVITSELHLGGKTDIYVEPTTLTNVSTLFNTVNTNPNFSGFGYVVLDNTVTLNGSLDISLKSFIQIPEGVFKIYYSEKTENKTKIYIDQSLTNGQFASAWSIFKYVDIDLTTIETEIIKFSDGITATITAGSVAILSEPIITKALPGDIIVTSNGTRLTILAMYGLKADVKERLSSIIIDSPIRVIRTSETSALPMSDIMSVTVSNQKLVNNKCLGFETISTHGAKILSKGVGFVSRCLLDLFIAPNMAEKRAQLPLIALSKSKFKIRHVRRDNSQDGLYNFDSRFDLGQYGSGYGYLDDEVVVATFAGGKESMEFSTADEGLAFAELFKRMFYVEVPLFVDMLIPGANNVFIALGDNVTDYEFPIEKFTNGNILRIDDGPNKGSYVIDKVLNIRLPNSFENIVPLDNYFRKPIQVIGDLQLGINNFENESYSVYTVTYHVNSSQSTRALFRNISIIKIKEKFPINVFDVLNSQLDSGIVLGNISAADLNNQDPGLNVLNFGRIGDIFINQIRSTTVKKILGSSATNKVLDLISSKFRGVLWSLNELSEFSDTFLENLYKVQYTYGTPARGIARMYTEDSTPVRLRPQRAQRYTINDVNKSVANIVDGFDNGLTLKPTNNWFKASKSTLNLILDDTESFSVIGAGTIDSKETWTRGIDVKSVNTLPTDHIFVPSVSSEYMDIINVPNSLEFISDIDDAKLNICKEIFVQKRTVRYVDQRFLKYMPIHIANSSLRSALLQGEFANIVSSAVALLDADVLDIGSRVNANNITYRNLINYYESLQTYMFLLVDQAVYETDPDSLKNLPRVVDDILGGTPILPGANYEERNAYWKTSTNLQSSDLLFYGYSDDDSELTGIGLCESNKMSNQIRLLSPISNASSSFILDDSLLSSDVFIFSNGELLDIYSVDSYDQSTGLITLDKNLTVTTPRVYNVGRIYYTTDNVLKILGFPGIQVGADNTFSYIGSNRDIGNESGILVDVTRSILSTSDIGRYMTIFNYVQSPEYTHIEGEDAYKPIRQNIGCYKIDDVSSIFRRSQFDGKDILVEQYIDLGDEFVDLFNFKGFKRLQIDDSEPIQLCFVVTDAPTIAPTKNADNTTSITTLLEVQFFSKNPTTFNIVSSSKDNKSLGIKILSDNSVPSVDSISPFVFKSGYNNINLSFERNNPHIFFTNSFLTVNNLDTIGGLYYTNIPFQSLGVEDAYNLINMESFDTFNEEIEGYELQTIDIDLARTTKERLRLKLPAKIVGVSPLLSGTSVQSTTNFALSIAESLFASNERVVCSDTLVKEKVRSYLGADIKYVGNVTEKQVIVEIIKVFDNALLSNTPVSTSSLIQYLHRLGVTRVITPIHLYHIVVDLDRRVYYRPITDVLQPNTDLDILATARLLTSVVPSYGTAIHGAKIVATRITDTTIIG